MSELEHYAKNIVETPVEDEISTSFMAYAMSVITARAIPDARDGLKPVQRRILYGLSEQGIRPGTPYKKCARVVGDVMGRYHPHGDSAIYEALVRMAQDFSMREPLVDGHGNFGTHNDPPAASRYTECRMAVAAAEMVAEIGEDTIDMRPNYDGTEIEPEVLPAKLPNLLLNGTSGIAVGMTTNIPSHNLAEVVAAARMMLADPEVSLEELMKVIPGPDLPTGGVIVDSGGIADYFATGRGSFKIRAKVDVARVSAKREGLVITELPYNIGAERLIGRIKKLLLAKQLDGIADIKDLTDRKRGLHIVIECKTGVNPKALLAELYAKTHLEESFSVISVALVNGRPETLSLKDMLKVFLDHRLEVVVRRARHRLKRAEDRAHILEGLTLALASMDEIVELLRRSKDTDTARSRLIKTFKLSEIQASHILEMPLRRLVALEVTKLKEELKELRATIADLKALLASPQRQRAIVEEELLDVVERMGDRRRSRIVKLSDVTDISGPLEVEEQDRHIVLRPDQTIYAAEAAPKAAKAVDDLVTLSLAGTNRTRVGIVTSQGRVLELNAALLPSADSVKVRLADLISVEPDEVPLCLVDLDRNADVLLVTEDGTVKRMNGEMIRGKMPLTILEAAKGKIVAAMPIADADEFVLVTAHAQLLRCDASQLRAQGKAGGGVAGIKLGEGDRVIAAMRHDDTLWLTTITDKGTAKRTLLSEYPTKGRNTAGVRCQRLKRGENALAFAGTQSVYNLKGKKLKEVEVAEGKRDAAGVELAEPVTHIGQAPTP